MNILTLSSLCILASALLASAQVPSLINYQGRLTDSSGAPVTGSKDFSLTIHDAQTGGNLLYTETIGAVTLDDTQGQTLFTDVTDSAIGMPPHYAILIADLNDDGMEELLVRAHDSANNSWSTQLWKRQAGFSYSDITAGSGLQGLRLVSAGDFNNNGLVDFLHVDEAGTEAAFYRNEGNGTFVKVPLTAAESSALFGFQGTVRAVDIDGDGDLDLVFGKALGSGGSIVAVLNQSRNGGSLNQPFSGVTTLAVTSWIHNGVEVTDANGDGKPDLLSIRTTGNWSSGTHPNFPATLFLNTGSSPADYINPDAAQNLAGFMRRDDCGINAANVMSPLVSWDINNNGVLDLINGSSDWPSVSRPHIYINDGQGNYTQMESPVYQSSRYYHHGISVFDADLDNSMDAVWTALHNFADTYPRMWRNDGDLAFTDVTSDWGITARLPSSGNHFMSGYHADLDGDGDFDFVVNISNDWGARESAYAIYRNNAVEAGANWLGIRLVASTSAPNGVGVRVEVTANGKKLAQYMADITGGVRNLSSLRFGLGTSDRATAVKVYWPSGEITELHNVEGNRIISVSEFTQSDWLFVGDASTGLTITGYKGSGENVNIPASINGIPVVGIYLNDTVAAVLVGRVLVPETAVEQARQQLLTEFAVEFAVEQARFAVEFEDEQVRQQVLAETAVETARQQLLTEVNENPNLFDLFRADQIQGMALGRPLLTKNPQDGKMHLQLGLRRSANLADWVDHALGLGDVRVEQGRLILSIQPQGDAQFYILEGDDAP